MLPVIETFTEDMKQVNTLLQLATATRNILQKLTIKDIQVENLPDYYFKVKFITEDGSTIETSAIAIPAGPTGATGPQGPQGETGATGAPGVSVISVTVNASNHLIVTLSTGATIDAGVIQTGGSGQTSLFRHSLAYTSENFTIDFITNDPTSWGTQVGFPTILGKFRNALASGIISVWITPTDGRSKPVLDMTYEEAMTMYSVVYASSTTLSAVSFMGWIGADDVVTAL